MTCTLIRTHACVLVSSKYEDPVPVIYCGYRDPLVDTGTIYTFSQLWYPSTLTCQICYVLKASVNAIICHVVSLQHTSNMATSDDVLSYILNGQTNLMHSQ